MLTSDAAATATDSRPGSASRGVLVVVLVGLSAFGPYLAGSVRTDQFVIYGLAVVLLPLTWSNIRLSPAAATLLGSWMVFVAVAGIVWATGGPVTPSAWGGGGGDPVSTTDNLVLPVVVFLLVLATVAAEAREAALQRLALIASLGMVVNACLALLQYAQPDSAGVLSPFWGAGGTAERALTVARFTGIISQPSVAGIMYALAIVCTVYVMRERPMRRLLLVLVLVVGGILTASKGFLLVGLPVGVWLLWKVSGTAGRRVALVLALLAAVGAADSLGLLATWSGLERLTYLLPGGGASMHDYLGNRYAETSPATGLTREVLDRAALSGYGLDGVAGATDSAIVHAIVVGGLVGLAAVAVATLTPLVVWLRRRNSMPQHEALLLGGLALVLLGGSVGAPVLVSNRLSVLVWALLPLMLTRSRSKPR